MSKFTGIRACLEAGNPVEEEPYEITHDVNGSFDGPRIGRTRAMTKAPKLFFGLSFYLSGYYMPYYKGYLEDLILAAGGVILQKVDAQLIQSSTVNGTCSKLFVVYSVEPPQGCNTDQMISYVLKKRTEDAEALAAEIGAHASILCLGMIFRSVGSADWRGLHGGSNPARLWLCTSCLFCLAGMNKSPKFKFLRGKIMGSKIANSISSKGKKHVGGSNSLSAVDQIDRKKDEETDALFPKVAANGGIMRNKKKKTRRRVQWKDRNGSKLVEVLEYQLSDSSDSDDEFLDSCLCTMM
ncbi:putative BRCT domain, BRCA1-associated, BRCT domain superfamily [Dioscorea sansibarensis]